MWHRNYRKMLHRGGSGAADWWPYDGLESFLALRVRRPPVPATPDVVG